jgi:hypothetical protein
MRRPRLWLALPLALYLLVPTRNYYWDGITFAINIEKGLPLRDLLSPSHLIYPVVGLWLYKLALLIGIKTRALFLLQTVNALLAGACVPLVERALRRRGVSTEAAVAGALAFAFAATWWKFATDVDAYIPAIFLVLCANDLLETRRSAWLAGLAHAAAMLFHQLALLYLVVALVRLKATRRALVYVVAAVVPTTAGFLLAYRTVFGRLDLAGLPAWLTTHSPDATFFFAPIGDLGFTLRGTLRLFFGGKVTSPWAIIAVLAGVVVVWRLSRTMTGESEKQDIRPDLVWLGVYAVFLFFWMPQNTFYRMFYLAPLILFAGSRLNGLMLRLLCTALFLWNAVFFIYPQSRVENNALLRFALAQHDRWPAGTPVAFHQFHPDLWTISYFNPQASWIGLSSMDVDVLERSRADAEQHGQPLWLEATAYDLAIADEAGRRWLASHPVTHLVRFKDPKHEFRFYEVR